MSANAEHPLGTPDEPQVIRDARRAYANAGDGLDLAAEGRATAHQRYTDAQAALANAEKRWGDALAECNSTFETLARLIREDRLRDVSERFIDPPPDVSMALAEHTAHALNTLSGGIS